MVICLGIAPEKRKNHAPVEDAMMFLGFWAFLPFLLFQVVRSKEFLLPCDDVAGQLAGDWEDEYAANFLAFFSGGARNFAAGHAATLWKSKKFDCTMGYPGEDVQQPFPFPLLISPSFLFVVQHK